MLSRDEVQARLAYYLTEMFEVPADQIGPAARLYEDLGLDSIDAVDLVVKLQELTGRKISPAKFKTVRTSTTSLSKCALLMPKGRRSRISYYRGRLTRRSCTLRPRSIRYVHSVGAPDGAGGWRSATWRRCMRPALIGVAFVC